MSLTKPDTNNLLYKEQVNYAVTESTSVEFKRTKEKINNTLK